MDSEACRPGKWIISYNGQPVFEAFNKGDIYIVPIVLPVPVASAVVSSVPEEEHITAAAVLRLQDQKILWIPLASLIAPSRQHPLVRTVHLALLPFCLAILANHSLVMLCTVAWLIYPPRV